MIFCGMVTDGAGTFGLHSSCYEMALMGRLLSCLSDFLAKMRQLGDASSMMIRNAERGGYARPG